MFQNEIDEEYFEYLYSYVDTKRYHRNISFRELMAQLHETPFNWTIPKDANRAEDGLDLRRRYAIDMGFDSDYFEDYLDGSCSVLEVMIALAIRIEETIMDDPSVGNRTSQWFWEMVVSLGLGSMTDDNIDEEYVESVIERFLDRDYEPNGKGGLFTIPNCPYDLRDAEIWFQAMWYLDSIT